MRISDWSSDVCSSDLRHHARARRSARSLPHAPGIALRLPAAGTQKDARRRRHRADLRIGLGQFGLVGLTHGVHHVERSEEHTSELQSLMRISYAVFCLKKKKQKNTTAHIIYHVPFPTQNKTE